MNLSKSLTTIFNILLILLLYLFCSYGFPLQNNTSNNLYSTTGLGGLTVEQIASLEKYDGRDYNLVPNVKDQGSSNMCWAYSCTNLAEVSILRSKIDPNATNENLSLSPENLAKSVYSRGQDPLKNVEGWTCNGNWSTDSGNFIYGADVFSQWCAPVRNNVSGDSYLNCAYRLTDSIDYNFFNPNIDSLIPIIKNAIAQYGAISTSYLNGRETYYYNPKNESSGVPHAIIIIGWDDTIPNSSFSPGSTVRNGGWLVKNSYNSCPYFYLSYDYMISSFMAVSFASNNDYDYNYYYDSAGVKENSNGIGGNSLYKTTKAANIFETKKSNDEKTEYLKAVNVHFSTKNTSCKVEIYTDLTDKTNPTSGTLATTETSLFEYGGYRTVKLTNPVKLNKGSFFSVVVELSGNNDTKITCAKQFSNNSYVYSYNSWNKITGYNTPRIKAYTSLLNNLQEDTKIDINIANLNLEYSSINYSGKENKPKITLTYNNNILTEGVDFSVDYTNNINVGKATITINGLNSFIGERIEYFDILPLQTTNENNNTQNKNTSQRINSKTLLYSLIFITTGTILATIGLIIVKKLKK